MKNTLTSEDKISIKSRGNLKDILPEDSPRNSPRKIEKQTLDNFLQEMRTSSSIERIAGSGKWHVFIDNSV